MPNWIIPVKVTVKTTAYVEAATAKEARADAAGGVDFDSADFDIEEVEVTGEPELDE